MKAKPLPSEAEKSRAWRKAVEAYWQWAHLESTAATRREDLEEIKAQKRRRMITLKETATRNLIYRLRAKMDRKFQELDPPVPAKLRVLTARVPSNSPTATSISPPLPSA